MKRIWWIGLGLAVTTAVVTTIVRADEVAKPQARSSLPYLNPNRPMTRTIATRLDVNEIVVHGPNGKRLSLRCDAVGNLVVISE